ncbi:sensor histidine kinase [Litorilituus sediminis]|uniref:histidine kinase n=1 Tax=Litorilituus sediminis TaxID=718192 RepID=A0A4P6P4K2_9GAMM|nr:HAMP domain-containing sensor histidine kinase [Litorilituus sediminis]QBG34327.1 HAMP domain-containing histidine kinase [Litorilituus sediminis]
MQVQACVDCHNNHPLTPKADWQLGDVRGVLEISTDITKQMALAEQISSAIVIFIMFAYVLLMVIFFFVTRRITKHVSYISKAMVELGDGNVDAQVDLASSTLEIGQMAKAFTTFKQALLKTQALEKRQQLMESEKIDGLGRMLASVAHDVNTPISIGITAASLMSDKIARIEEQIAKGELTKSDMEKFIASATESMQVVSSNLVSAGNLIKSFKQVSVDQISEEQRQIVLSEYINEIVHSLKPRLTRAKATVLVDCQQDCQFYTYPGLLSQVVSNLITNSLIHGFGQKPGGKIIITLNGNAEGNINIHYQDDGIGIPVEHQDKVMEPFFTTKREQGGSGLGLSIVHTIVTQKLAGKIKLVSNQEQGVIFDICFPAKCPSKEAEP